MQEFESMLWALERASGSATHGCIASVLLTTTRRWCFQHEGEGGTIVVPGHGYVSDEHEVVEYRDMLVIIRDRVNDMIKKGATLAQVQAARLTADYDTRFGATSGPWTTDMFVEAVYNSLKNPPKAAN